MNWTKKTMTRLQTLQSTMKWHHLEKTADILMDAYSYLLSHQSMILAVNSSFVDPLSQFESQMILIELAFRTIFAIPNLKKVKQMGQSSEDIEDLENLYHNIFNIYEDTLMILVSKDLYKLQILKEMMMWMNKDKFFQQERVLLVITKVLNFASKESNKSKSVDAPCLGFLAAEMSLLCFHDDPAILKQASVGMYYILYIAKCQNLKNAKRHCKNSEHWNHCQSFPADLELLPKILQQDKLKIVLSIGQSPLPFFLTDFVWSLLKKLSGSDCETASEAAAILLLTLEYHAQKVTMVSKILDNIYKELSGNYSQSVKDAMLQVISLLTRASPKKVIFQLMDYPVPADKTLKMMWEAASTYPSVAPQVLKTILLILKGKPGEMEDSMMDKRRFSLDAANMMPVMASQALCTFLSVKSYKKAVAQNFPQLLMSLVLQLFYSSQMKMLPFEDRPLFAQEALRVLLNCSGLQNVDIALMKKNCWNKFSQAVYHRYGVYLIAKTLSDFNFPQFTQTLHYLHKISMDGSRRSEDSIITIIFFTELLNNFFKDAFPEELLVLYKNWVNDPSPEVSKLSLQKIGSISPTICNMKNLCSLLMAILDAFLSKEKTVVIRALLTLRRMLAKLEKGAYSSVCIKIASSYCPLMDHNDGGIRSMAIRHYGDLLIDIRQYKGMLNHVVLGGLVPLILFLEDTETRVVQACKYTLEICDLELKWSISHLLEDGNYSFELVVLNICNNLLSFHESAITDLISDTLGFLGSSRAHLRRGAIILIGYLAKLGANLLAKEEIEVMLEVAERVLLDSDPVIKQLTEKTCEIFREIAYQISSSTIKQTSGRFFKLFSTKKMKPIYNWSGEENSYVLEIKDLKNLEEIQVEEEEEDSEETKEIPSNAFLKKGTLEKILEDE